MPREDKITAVERDQRVDLVCEFLIKGLTRAQMLQYISKKTTWNVVDRQVDNYISSAKKKIKGSDIDRDFEIKKAMRRLENLYVKNEKNEDYRECRTVIESMAKLFGWNEPSKVDHTSNGETLSFTNFLILSSEEDEE